MGSLTKNFFSPTKSILNPVTGPLGKVRGSIQKKIHGAFGLSNIPTPTEATTRIQDSIIK